jgi:hypothetical protein
METDIELFSKLVERNSCGNVASASRRLQTNCISRMLVDQLVANLSRHMTVDSVLAEHPAFRKLPCKHTKSVPSTASGSAEPLHSQSTLCQTKVRNWTGRQAGSDLRRPQATSVRPSTDIPSVSRLAISLEGCERCFLSRRLNVNHPITVLSLRLVT